VISLFLRKVDENYALLGYYAASSGSFFYRRFGTTCRILVSLTLKIGLIDCHETSVTNYHHSLRYNPEERSFQLFSYPVYAVVQSFSKRMDTKIR